MTESEILKDQPETLKSLYIECKDFQAKLLPAYVGSNWALEPMGESFALIIRVKKDMITRFLESNKNISKPTKDEEIITLIEKDVRSKIK